jgi:hypothetical protein
MASTCKTHNKRWQNRQRKAAEAETVADQLEDDDDADDDDEGSSPCSIQRYSGSEQEESIGTKLPWLPILAVLCVRSLGIGKVHTKASVWRGIMEAC